MSALSVGDDAPQRRLRVLVVDDHEIVHWGLRVTIGRQPWVERCVPAYDRRQAGDLTRRFEPHIALIDLFVGDDLGVDVAQSVREAWPATRILFISGSGHLSARAARRAGGHGFIRKDTRVEELLRAIESIAAGGEAFAAPAGPVLGHGLTARQLEIMELVAAGLTNRQIAARLYLSSHTVKQHTSSAYRKLQVRNRAEAVRRAQSSGLLRAD
jgi:DNA-binding NarL/FixJ family response regulator